MGETGKTIKQQNGTGNGLDGVDFQQLGRANQALVETSLACWQEMLSFSQVRVQQTTETMRKLCDCRTPADTLQVQAEETWIFTEACVQEGQTLAELVCDGLLGPSTSANAK